MNDLIHIFLNTDVLCSNETVQNIMFCGDKLCLQQTLSCSN